MSPDQNFPELPAHICLSSPVGSLTIFEEDDAVIVVEWGRAPDPSPTKLLEEAKRQLDAYFAGDLKIFDLPLRPTGTDFQRAVCDAMSKIPYGEVQTYGDLADDLGSAARAVGGACGHNPIPILIPCHRVVGTNGKLTGFSGGEGVDTKRQLLRHEQRNTPLPLFRDQ